MTKLKGQSYDTEECYASLGIKKLEEYAIKTGLYDGKASLDADILLSIFQTAFPFGLRVLEVGCGYGRIGLVFTQHPKIEYWGIDLHKPFVDFFRSKIKNPKKVLHGNFLKHRFPFDRLEVVVFPWSVIGDFSSNEGQVLALRKTRNLLVSKGLALIDIPTDIINKYGGYEPGHFNVHERYNLKEIGLKYARSHNYVTLAGRNREIIEISAI